MGCSNSTQVADKNSSNVKRLPRYSELYGSLKDGSSSTSLLSKTQFQTPQRPFVKQHYGDYEVEQAPPVGEEYSETLSSLDKIDLTACHYNYEEQINLCTMDYRVSKATTHKLSVDGKNFSAKKPWIDPNFTKHVALGTEASNLHWKRPHEICSNPRLYCDGTTRFDIGQGAVGSCWFLSILSSISQNQTLMSKVITQDSYHTDPANYTGVFTCRFWKFGTWHEVSVDDCLPVTHVNELWGAFSATNNNEMWVPLLEKAFAKFHGSYQLIFGGTPGDAYVSLTGGIVDSFNFTNLKEPKDLHLRIQHALEADSLIACSVPIKFDRVNGLIGGHAYSLTAAVNVRIDGRRSKVPLLRLRNPWGSFEWTGPWSDKSKELSHSSLQAAPKDDGEFYMDLNSFLTYFTHIAICSLKPDIDKDGKDDQLDYRTCVYGEWIGTSAKGFKEKLLAPKYIFVLPHVDNMATIPIALQLIQYREKRHSDIFAIRIDIFKVENHKYLDDIRGEAYILNELFDDESKDTSTYHRDRQVIFRHRLSPGQYVIIPSTMNSGEESQYYIRLFTPCRLYNFSQLKKGIVMSHHIESHVIHNNIPINTSMTKSWVGEWLRGVNSGGQVGYKSHNLNPQLEFWTSDGVPYEVIQIVLAQDVCGRKLPIGFKLYKVGKHQTIPLDYTHILNNYNKPPLTTDNETGRFVNSYSVAASYVLPPSTRYLCIFFTDNKNDEKVFGILFLTQRWLRCQMTQIDVATRLSIPRGEAL